MYIIYVFDIICKNLGGVRVLNLNLLNFLKKVNKNRLFVIFILLLKFFFF